MNNVHSIIAVALASVLGATHGASAESFQCAFLQGKYNPGKSNVVTCAMTPEKAFSTRGQISPTNEHCKAEPIYSYEDLEEVAIDLSKGTVSWIRTIGLTEDAKPVHKKYLLKEGISEGEADIRVNAPPKQKPQAFKIFSYHKSNDKVWVDEITGKLLLDSPTLVPQHSLTFGDEGSLFHMYIPESTRESILLEPNAGTGGISWVNIRFGLCRKL